MGKVYNNGIKTITGLKPSGKGPVVDNQDVETFNDLLTLSPVFIYIRVTVHDEGGVMYMWNGLAQSNSDNWIKQGVSSYPSTQTLSGASITQDCSISVNSKVTLTGDTTITLSSLVNGMSGNIKVTQDSTGEWGLTLLPTPNVINGGASAIELTGDASSVDIISWWYDGTDLNVTYGLNYN